MLLPTVDIGIIDLALSNKGCIFSVSLCIVFLCLDLIAMIGQTDVDYVGGAAARRRCPKAIGESDKPSFDTIFW